MNASSDADEHIDSQLSKVTDELVKTLSLGHYRLLERASELPSGRLGAIIPLVGPVQIQLILLSSNTGIRALAERFLDHSADEDERLTGDDVRDAVRELANQFAGLAKRRFSTFGDMRLGLPVFIRGTVGKAHGVKTVVHTVMFDDIEVVVAIMISQ